MNFFFKYKNVFYKTFMRFRDRAFFVSENRLYTFVSTENDSWKPLYNTFSKVNLKCNGKNM